MAFLFQQPELTRTNLEGLDAGQDRKFAALCGS
jgi:hypothetical protein